MWHSYLNDIEIPETKRFIPKGLNWVQHRVSRIDLFLSRLSELVWKLEGEISLQLELKRLPSLGPPAKGN